MRKLAKIESPSEDEKKHISEEEMYIDQPVVDNIKNNKILNKRRDRNMSYYDNAYESLVSEAYEDILDSMEKEAADNQAQHEARNRANAYAVFSGYDKRNRYENPKIDTSNYEKQLRKEQKQLIKELGDKAKGDPSVMTEAQIKKAVKAYAAQQKGNAPLQEKYRGNSSAASDSAIRTLRNKSKGDTRDALKGMLGTAKWHMAETKDNLGRVWKNAPTSYKALAIGVPSAAALAGIGGYAAYRHRKKKKEAEKTAFDWLEDAMFAKEAAENDYATACAYEDAAMQVLDDLGYFDDYEDDYDYED